MKTHRKSTSTAKAQRLGLAVDLIARRCYRGVSALLGKSPRPTQNELIAAVLYQPASSLKSRQTGRDWVATAACQLADFEADLNLVPWENLVVAAKEYAKSDPIGWKIYLEYARFAGGALSRKYGSRLVLRLSKKFFYSPRSIRRIASQAPKDIARLAIIKTAIN